MYAVLTPTIALAITASTKTNGLSYTVSSASAVPYLASTYEIPIVYPNLNNYWFRENKSGQRYVVC